MRLTFAASGYLYKHDLVMWDPQTETLWNQILGAPIGTLVDGEVEREHPEEELAFVPSEVARWGAYKQQHPGALMLQRAGASYGGAYTGYNETCQQGISGDRDCDIDGLHPKDRVLGVDVGGEAAAYPLFALNDQPGGVLLTDQGGKQLAVAVRPGGSAAAYDTEGREFERDPTGFWVDGEGRTWDLQTGTRTNGSESLSKVDSLVLFWFAWQDHHPDTELWLPAQAEGGLETDDGQLPGFTVWVVVTSLLVMAFLVRRRMRG